MFICLFEKSDLFNKLDFLPNLTEHIKIDF